MTADQVRLVEDLGVPFQRFVTIEAAGDATYRWRGTTVELSLGERRTIDDDQVAYIEAMGLSVQRLS